MNLNLCVASITLFANISLQIVFSCLRSKYSFGTKFINEFLTRDTFFLYVMYNLNDARALIPRGQRARALPTPTLEKHSLRPL